MKRCRLCLIPDTRPDTPFADGICSGCIAFAARPDIDWDARRRDLEKLLEKNRRPGAAFDCIVPSSGGKDSHYQVLKLLELGARPLVVTATTCHQTPVGRANIANLARYATTLEYSPNKRVRAALNRIGLKTVGDISWPEHVGIFTIPFRLAVQMKIPLIFYGENPQNQYGGPFSSQEARTMTARWVSEFGGFLGLRAGDMVGQEGITPRDMEDYRMPGELDIAALRIEAHFLGQYLPWDSNENARLAASAGMIQAMPCRANWWPHENLDNAQTGLHDHMMYRKYGYGRLAAQISVDIRAQRISREYALRLAAERDGLFPRVYAEVALEEVLDAIEWAEKGGEETLMELLDRFTNHALFRGEVNDRPILKEEV